MQDSRKYLRDRLGKLGLGTRREEEILSELGEHLADHAADLEARGVARDAAAREALNTVPNWHELRQEIQAAETEEAIMNYRSKVLWLPALGAITLSNVLLALFQIFGAPPHFHWLSADKSMEPYFVFVIPWLITQPVVGAAAAYGSRRAGGAVRHQLLAALAPAMVLLGLFLLILPFSFLDKHVAHNIRLSAYVVFIVSWVLLPGVTLLIGAAPFLRKPQPHA